MDIPHWSRPRNVGWGSDRSLDTGEGPGCRDLSDLITRNWGQDISLHIWYNPDIFHIFSLVQVYRMFHNMTGNDSEQYHCKLCLQ